MSVSVSVSVTDSYRFHVRDYGLLDNDLLNNRYMLHVMMMDSVHVVGYMDYHVFTAIINKAHITFRLN